MNFDQSYHSEHSSEQQPTQKPTSWRNPRALKETTNQLSTKPTRVQEPMKEKRQVVTVSESAG